MEHGDVLPSVGRAGIAHCLHRLVRRPEQHVAQQRSGFYGISCPLRKMVEEFDPSLQRAPPLEKPIVNFYELDTAVLILRRRLPFLVHLCVMAHFFDDVVFQVVCHGSEWIFVVLYAVLDEIGKCSPTF